MQFQTKPFQNLTVSELHALYALRCKVFVVEQNCPYQEVDDKDLNSLHVMGYVDGLLVACARIIAPGVSYPEPSIGRVAVEIKQRGNNVGKKLMEFILLEMNRLYPRWDIVISAQEYLYNFYVQLGFEAEGEVYLEDNIPHLQMRKRANKASNR